MQAAVIADGAITVREVDDPTPGPKELLVRVRSAGINAADLLQRAGFYPAPPGSPSDIPGMEFSGVVEQVGAEVDAWREGERVMAVVGGGAQAELVVVHASHALAVPDSIDLVAAGGFPEAYATAHDALVSQGGLERGSRVLVSGATGGVGTAAVQLAHALGAVVVASARDVTRHASLRALGADEVVVPDDVASAGPFDVVLELVGAASLSVTAQALAPWARLVVIGVAAGGSHFDVDLLRMMQGRWTLTGSTLRSRSVTDKAAVAEAVRRDVLPLLAQRNLTVVVQQEFALSSIEAAYESFARPGKFGKLVLTPDA